MGITLLIRTLQFVVVVVVVVVVIVVVLLLIDKAWVKSGNQDTLFLGHFVFLVVAALFRIIRVEIVPKTLLAAYYSFHSVQTPHLLLGTGRLRV